MNPKATSQRKSLNAKDFERPSHGPKTDEFIGMTGAQAFHEMMQRHNVECIFGYPGGAILPVFDAIYNSPHFDFVLARHEQGAGHMAEGYARRTGKPGIVLVTSGPGATNTVTPLQDALMDGTPMIVFSGQVATGAIGSDAFQEADITGITRSCTKWNVLVKDVREIPRRINEAFHIATTGRPGPVLIDMPKDITASVIKEAIDIEIDLPGYHVRELGTSSEIERAAEMINNAKKPLFYVGQGCILSDGVDVMRECAAKADIPVTTTLLGLGAYDETLPGALHMVGMHGSAYANWAMDQADVVVSIGARFDDRVTGDLKKFAASAREAELLGRGGIIHFDIAPENINKSVTATIGVEGDARKNLELLLPMLKQQKHPAWHEQIQQWKQEHPFRYKDDGREFHLKPQAVIEELNRQTQGEAIISTGVGQHQMWAAQFYDYKHPSRWITSGGAGTMGFGVPASVGAMLGEMIKAKLEGRKPLPVINIDGDGSFSMTAMEMTTAAQYKIPAKTIILNNNFQGMVKQWQDLFYEERYSHTQMHNPDFVQLVEAMHCKGFRCTKKEDLPRVIKAFLKHDGPAVLDCLVEKHEHVYPMMPAGKSVNDMVLGNFD